MIRAAALLAAQPLPAGAAEALARAVVALLAAGIAAAAWRGLRGAPDAASWEDEMPPRPDGPVPPPWVAFPGSEPWSFRQGNPEGWLRAVFLPHWRALGAAERDAYLERNPPPDEDWDAYLRRHWA